jgi:flagellar biosynthesis chaperone FliJ
MKSRKKTEVMKGIHMREARLGEKQRDRKIMLKVKQKENIKKIS